MEEDDTTQVLTPDDKEKLIKEIEQQQEEDEEQEEDWLSPGILASNNPRCQVYPLKSVHSVYRLRFNNGGLAVTIADSVGRRTCPGILKKHANLTPFTPTDFPLRALRPCESINKMIGKTLAEPQSS